jgi:hypothetical protein
MQRALGNNLNIGVGIDGSPVAMTAEQRATHLFICGSTGTGKSKLLEHLIRQDIAAWRASKCGMLVIDPHGSLYDSLMKWLSWNKWDRPIVPIDLRQDDWVIGYNVLRQRPGADPAVLINNFVQAMSHVWGESGIQSTPLFARWASNVLGTLYSHNLTLVEADMLTDAVSKGKRYALTDMLPKSLLANDWKLANSLEPVEFDNRISSTVNRLRTFLATQKLRQMFGQSGRSLDLGKALSEGQIILVNLATEKNRVSEEDGALFATLLLSDLWTAARERGKGTDAKQVKPFYVYADEFQNFITPTMAKNLDQARGFGLHLTLANQFPRQILHSGAQGEQVYDSLMANARSKIVFEIRGEENLRPLALDLFMGMMSPDKIKHDLYSTKVLSYDEQVREIRSFGRSKGTSTGQHRGHAAGAGFGGTLGFTGDDIAGDPNSTSMSESQFAADSESTMEGHSESESESVARVPFMVPKFGKELSSRQFEPLEEQIFRAMAVLHDQKQRHSVARIVGSKGPAVVQTPTIKSPPGSEVRTKEYLARCYARLPYAVRSALAKKQLENRAATVVEEITKKKPGEPSSSGRRVG